MMTAAQARAIADDLGQFELGLLMLRESMPYRTLCDVAITAKPAPRLHPELPRCSEWAPTAGRLCKHPAIRPFGLCSVHWALLLGHNFYGRSRCRGCGCKYSARFDERCLGRKLSPRAMEILSK